MGRLTECDKLPAEQTDIKYTPNSSLDHTNEITTFENDMNIIVEAPPKMKTLSSILTSHHTDDRDHSIIDFLQRPQIILESTWNGDYARNKQITYPVLIPDSLINKPMYAEKLKGFTSFKATAVLTYQFQSQPFQAGRAIISALPLPTLNTDKLRFISTDVARLQLLNHVQCDISKQTEVTLKVPFVSPFNAYDLVTKLTPWASVLCSVYSPIAQVGNVPIDVIVYGHFEDIEMGTPTSGLIAQSGEEPEAFSDVRQRAKERGNSFHSRTGSALSGLLDTASNGLKGVQQNFLKPLDDLVGPILALLGFSKPIAPMQDPLVLRPSGVFGTTDGKDMSQPLSLMENTNVPFIPNIDGSSYDEMSFDWLKKIPQFFSQFKYTANSAKGSLLWSTPVSCTYNLEQPLVLQQDSQMVTLDQPTHLYYICSPFKYWAGGLVYTFKFVKTDFHSGRVEFTYHPFSDYIDGISIPDYCYRLVVDLREKNEVSFVVPFVSPTPFKRVGMAPAKTYSADTYVNTGTLVCRALTALKSSSSIVSSSIEVLVEVNAAEDFHVIAPIDSQWLPFTLEAPIIAQSGVSGSEQENPRSRAIEVDPPSIMMGTTQVPDLSVAISGETFKNFRTFIKRSAFIVKYAKEQVPIQFVPHTVIRPPPLYMATYQENDDNKQNFGLGFFSNFSSPVSFVAGMYALYRGGLRIKVFCPDMPNIIGAAYKATPPGYGGKYYNTYPIAIEQPSVKAIAEFQLPYYSSVLTASLGAAESKYYYSYPRNSVEINKDKPSATYIAISAGDDMSFAVFTGTPPCVSLYQARTQVNDGKNTVSFLVLNDYDPLKVPESHPLPQKAKLLSVSDIAFNV